MGSTCNRGSSWRSTPHAKLSRVRHAPEDTLSATPAWLDRRYGYLADAGGALVIISGDPEPDLLAGLDERRAGLDRMPALASRFLVQQHMLVAWNIACYPTPEWARAVFGAPDVELLWTHLERFMRLDQPDPAAAFRTRMDELRARARQLTELRFDAIHYGGPGNDLTVGLIPSAHWDIAELTGPHGKPMLVNMPTEEVYTTPDYRRAEGTIASTKPLALNQTVVRDLRLTIRGGKITEVSASSGADVVRSQLTRDEGASRLGELALVDESSPIGQSGVTFLDTGLDENAACHIAWGAGLPSALDGGVEMTSEQLLELGVNQSGTHVDFMVGGPEVVITGIRDDGSRVELMREERWQI